MKKKRDNKNFWNRYAKLYDFEIHRFNSSAYSEMYRLMSMVLTKEMRVLEVATGTGLIAINIADSVQSVEATDFSPKMIEAAMKKTYLITCTFPLRMPLHSLLQLRLLML